MNKYEYLPVEGCEQCEYNIEAVGDDAGACDECIAYGEAEKAENCECGLTENGEWDEALFDQWGCNCEAPKPKKEEVE